MENESPAYKRRNSQPEQATHEHFLPAMAMDFLHGRKWNIQVLCHVLSQKIQRLSLKSCRSAHAESIPDDDEPQEKRQDEQRVETFDEGNRGRERNDECRVARGHASCFPKHDGRNFLCLKFPALQYRKHCFYYLG